MKRILVTGAAGLLGGHVVEALRDRYEVVGLDLARGEADIEWHTGDITDAELVRAAAARCDAIVQELFIRESRLETIDMVPFAYSAQSIVVRAGSDLEIASPEDLSGLKVAVPPHVPALPAEKVDQRGDQMAVRRGVTDEELGVPCGVHDRCGSDAAGGRPV